MLFSCNCGLNIFYFLWFAARFVQRFLLDVLSHFGIDAGFWINIALNFCSQFYPKELQKNFFKPWTLDILRHWDHKQEKNKIVLESCGLSGTEKWIEWKQLPPDVAYGFLNDQM